MHSGVNQCSPALNCTAWGSSSGLSEWVEDTVIFTRFRDIVPEGGVKLILRLHDLGEESGLAVFIKGRVTTESARRGQ